MIFESYSMILNNCTTLGLSCNFNSIKSNFAEPHKLASSRGAPLLYDRDILFGFSKLHIKATLASFNPKPIGLKFSREDEFNTHK